MSRTSLTRYAPLMRDEDPTMPHRMATAAWHQTGMVVITPESIARLDWQDRELVQAIATKLYGKREAK